jgi:hypothetical protein
VYVTNTISFNFIPPWMAHIYNPCLKALKSFFNLSPPLHLQLIEVDLTGDINKESYSIFHLDSPGQSMSWKDQVFLMFCTLSVYWCIRNNLT